MAIQKILLVILSLSVLLLFGCSRTTSYYVKVGNIGNTGVIIIDAPFKFSYPKKLDQGLRGRDNGAPRSPSIRRNYLMPPDEIEVTWQLAELNNCEISRARHSRKGYFTKYGCEWNSIPDKIFTKTIDLRDAKKSKAFKEKGRWAGIFKTRRKAAIIFDFDDDEVIVSTIGWSHNKLK